MTLRIIFTFFWLGALSIPTFAQLSESATISIWTCRQGDDVWNVFGHTAIKVEDPVTAKFEIYNYGMFNFDEPGFTLKFLRGKLLYSLGIQSKGRFYNGYTDEERSIFEQKLNLTTEQKNTIYLKLRENFKKENRRYLYDFFFDNCSTRQRDIIYNSLENVSDINDAKPTKTFRQLLDEYTFASPWMDFGIDLIIGKIADDVASNKDMMFLPDYLFQRLKNTQVNGAPLVIETNTILDFEAEHVHRQKVPFFSPQLLFGLFFLLELILFFIFFKKTTPVLIKFYDGVWFTLLAISSIIILFMWFGTDHDATKQNLNVLWLNPLFFVLLFTKKKWVYWSLLISLGLALLVSSFLQQYHIASIIIICTIVLKLLRRVNAKYRLSDHNLDKKR